MERQSRSEVNWRDEQGTTHSLSALSRIYLHGCLAFVVFLAAAYVVRQLIPIFDFTGSPWLAVTLSVLAIVVVPPLVGSAILYGVLPWLGRREAWRGLNAWDDRLINEISNARQRAQIVIINWPSEQIRTMGVQTATFDGVEPGSRMAAVYVPTAPQTRLGYIRIVPVEDVVPTDWTLREWQLFQLTFGSVSPDKITEASLQDPTS